MTGVGRGEPSVVEVPWLRALRIALSGVEGDRTSQQWWGDLAAFVPVSMDDAVSTPSHHGRDDQAFIVAFEIGRVLDVAARVVTWLMDVQELPFDRRGFAVAARTMPAVASAASTRAVLEVFATRLSDLVSCEGSAREDGLLALRLMPRLTWEPERYDFFISYKHLLHPMEAQAVTSALRSRRFRCFIDVHDLPPEAARADLHLALRRALDASRCCVFFETALEVITEENLVGHTTAPSVHVYELRHARNVVVVRRDPPEVYTPADTWRRSWSGIEDLADRLEERLEAPHVTTRGGDPELEPALGAARRCVSDVLAREVELAPLAALAVAASDRADVTTAQLTPARGEAVLTTLLRLDLETSLALEEAGLPPEAWSAACASRPKARWREKPFRGIAESWPDAVVQELRERVARYGVFDEAALGMGLLGEARHPRSSAGMALRRALLALPQRPGLDDRRLEAQAGDVIDRGVRILSQRAGVPRHGWLSVKSAGTMHDVPVSRCGPFHLEAMTVGEVSLELLAKQDHELYPDDVLNAYAAAIRDADEGDEEDGEGMSGIFPEISLTLTSDMWPVAVVDISASHDGSLFLAMRSADAEVPAGGTLRNVLPGRLARPVGTGLLRGDPGGHRGIPLDDLLSLWDLCSRANRHLAVRALDPAQLPTGRGEVVPTATATGPGSLWPATGSGAPRGRPDTQG